MMDFDELPPSIRDDIESEIAQWPVRRTVCPIVTVARHPTGGKTRGQLESEVARLEAENAQLRAKLKPHGWGS